jgi:streptogramin lyase
MTTNGAATVFLIPSGADITGLIARRDGTLWFSERWVTGGSTSIGRIITAGQITETSFSLKK